MPSLRFVIGGQVYGDELQPLWERRADHTTKEETTMNAERENLIKIAEERGIAVNKFWTTKKLNLEVNGGISQKERRSDAMRRAWDSRRQLFGPNGMKPKTEQAVSL